MTTDDGVILFLGLLAVLCQIAVALLALLGVAAWLSPAARVRRREVTRALAPVAAWFAFCVSAVTMAGSLYLSEVKHYEPCHLCWIQRGLLYPQVVFTAVLALKPNLLWLRRVAIAMLIICLPIAGYHVLLEHYPSLETSACTYDNPCSQRFIYLFHYMGTPFMAATSALTVLALLLIQRAVAMRELLLWIVVSAIELTIVLTAGGAWWQLVPLPILLVLALSVRDRRAQAGKSAQSKSSSSIQ